jgi:Low molecular weight phosphotyrosine protein phosphatase
VNPQTVSVLRELGLDWSRAVSKSVTQFVGEPFDYVITVCDRARKSCPVFPGEHNSLHWGLDDPAEVAGTEAEKLEAFRRTRTEVATRLRPFVELAARPDGSRYRRPEALGLGSTGFLRSGLVSRPRTRARAHPHRA